MPKAFAVFMICWIAIGIASWIFYATATYQTKKAAHPYLLVAFTIIFLGFTEWMMQGKVPLFWVAGVIVIMYLNYRNTQFCETCGATIYARGFTRSMFCPKCGAPLQRDLTGGQS